MGLLSDYRKKRRERRRKREEAEAEARRELHDAPPVASPKDQQAWFIHHKKSLSSLQSAGCRVVPGNSAVAEPAIPIF